MNNDKSNTEVHKPKPQPILWGEIVKGWEWVVFSCKTLGRVGGPKEIISTLFSTLVILLQRTKRQWNYEKNNK